MKKNIMWTTLFLYFFGSIFWQIILDLLIPNKNSLGYLFGQIAMYILLIIPLIIINKNELNKMFKDLKKNAWKHLKTGLIIWLIFFIIMMGLNFFINYVILSPISLNNNEVLIRETINGNIIHAFILFVLLIPVLEELVFRHGFSGIKNKHLFLMITGSIFAFMHLISDLNNPVMLIYFFPYLALGLAFGLAYQKTNNVFTSIIVHIIHNLICMIMLII